MEQESGNKNKLKLNSFFFKWMKWQKHIFFLKQTKTEHIKLKLNIFFFISWQKHNFFFKQTKTEHIKLKLIQNINKYYNRIQKMFLK